MGNHRADRRSRKRLTGEETPVTPSGHQEYRPKRRADVPPDTISPRTSVPPSTPVVRAEKTGSTSGGGRRKAEPGVRREVRRAESVSQPSAAARPAPKRDAESAPKRDAEPAPKRRAQPAPKRRAQSASSPLIKVPALPTMVGAVALVAAAGGAIGMGGGTLPGPAGLQLSAGSAASNLTGTDAIGFTDRDSRAKAISRDSARQALQDAADQDLKAAAEEQSQQRNARLASLAASAEKRGGEIAKNRWVLPTVGYHLTARFGWSSGLWSHGHTGLDFAAHVGTPIYAVANGVITETGYDGAYGNKTIQTLPDGTEIWYCHQNSINVSVGDKVIQGHQIGEVGSTGNTTGPHLHIEVRPGGGDPVDPYPAFLYHRVTP